MEIKLYKECKIVPFDYNKEKYTDIINCDIVGEFFTAEKFESQVLNEQGRALLTEEGKYENEMVMKKFILSDKGRRVYNLNSQKNYRYSIKCGKYNFQVEIDNIELWFFKNGKGFLTIQIKEEQRKLNKEMLFRLHALQWFSNTTKLNWEKSIAKDVKEHRTLTLKELTLKCLENCADLNIQKKENESYDVSLVMTDALEDIYNKDDSAKYCLKMQLHRTDISIGNELYDVKVCDYIHWTLSERAMLSWVDETMAGDKDRAFLDDKGSFRKSVFHNYLGLYLYYLSRYLECKSIEQLTGKILNQSELKYKEMSAVQKIETKFPVLTEENYKRIDTILRENLCEKQWKLQERLETVCEKIGLSNQFTKDVFISYRHDGGQYLALLLYERLTSLGFSVFWDRRSLRAGSYKEQLYESIEECKKVIAIISPGSMERLNEKDDWVRKELVYAFGHEKDVLLLLLFRCIPLSF